MVSTDNRTAFSLKKEGNFVSGCNMDDTPLRGTRPSHKDKCITMPLTGRARKYHGGNHEAAEEGALVWLGWSFRLARQKSSGGLLHNNMNILVTTEPST